MVKNMFVHRKMVNLRLRVAHSREQSHDYEAWRVLIYYDKRRLNADLCEDSRTSTSFPFLQAGPTSNLRVFGDKSIGVSFIQIAQTVRELLTCFDPPTQRGQTIVRVQNFILQNVLTSYHDIEL